MEADLVVCQLVRVENLNSVLFKADVEVLYLLHDILTVVRGDFPGTEIFRVAQVIEFREFATYVVHHIHQFIGGCVVEWIVPKRGVQFRDRPSFVPGVIPVLVLGEFFRAEEVLDFPMELSGF